MALPYTLKPNIKNKTLIITNFINLFVLYNKLYTYNIVNIYFLII